MDSPDTAATRRLICDVILGRPRGPGPQFDTRAVAAFNARLRYHGVAGLFARGLADADALGPWPEAVVEFCREQTHARAVLEMTHRRRLAQVLAALDATGATPLLLKGTPLAYTHYPSPVLRPRGDSDVLIAPAQRRRAEEALRDLGYARALGVSGTLISTQSAWTIGDPLGITHAVDLHWRINNAQALACLLDHAELADEAQPVPALGPHARAPSPVHALLIACQHRAGHGNAPYFIDDEPHPASERLIWLYDIHLLASRMSPAELSRFAEEALRRRMAWICLEALRDSAHWFDTPLPAAVPEALQAGDPMELSARYCRGGPAEQLLCDLLALEGTRVRLRLLGEHLFPPADYMRARYADAPLRWLPLLYARRAAGAAQRLWRG